MEAFEIARSLSHKGCPYDTVVAEATFIIIKTEFVKNQALTNLTDLKLQLVYYVNWFNNHRIHLNNLEHFTPTVRFT